MADAVTTILRRAGEVSDPALSRCELAQAFARVILCLRAVRCADDKVLATSLADPSYAASLTTAKERWAELAIRLEFIDELPFTPGHPNGMLIQAATVMRTGLSVRAPLDRRIPGASPNFRGVLLMPQSESRLAWQASLLVQEAMGLFEAVSGLNRVASGDGGILGQPQAAQPLLKHARRKAHVGANVATPAGAWSAGNMPAALTILAA
ncbi:hypothetical protein [Paracoccus actinidiae]|uniref:hypothetical protein n=1 Tax=Paracoccus actinidiae TaxID=3064531 RepID=UPI0027D1FC52|nr:hypothetical protein [Paracoccus sp. M09]